MSAFGTKRTSVRKGTTSAFDPKTDIAGFEAPRVLIGKSWSLIEVGR